MRRRQGVGEVRSGEVEGDWERRATSDERRELTGGKVTGEKGWEQMKRTLNGRSLMNGGCKGWERRRVLSRMKNGVGWIV